MTAATPFVYFFRLGLHAPYALLILLLVVLTGLWTIALSPAELDSGLGMILFVQMFLASSGFVPRARRGHFDPVLTWPADRRLIVMTHWAVSVMPGTLGWLILAATGEWLGSPTASSALLGTRAAALFIVSAVAWAAGFTLARGTAGFLWISALFAVLLRRSDLIASSSVAALVFCPFGLMRATLDGASVCAAVLCALVLLLAAWRSAASLDVYLVERA